MPKFKIDKQQIVDVLKKRWWVMLIEFLFVGVILVLDLVSKQYVCDYLRTQPGLSHDFIKGFIDFQYTENTGAGFGVLAGNTVALTVLTIIVVIGLMCYLFLAQKQSEWLRISLIFISAGGIGNVVDRIGLGYVRDFIQFSFWPEFAIFNVADAFVTVGAFMLIIVLIVMLVQEGRKGKKEFEEKQKQEAENGGAKSENGVDPFEQPVNDFLPNENPQGVEVKDAQDEAQNEKVEPSDSDLKEFEEDEENDDIK